jgi:hypothetical protein
VKSFADRLPDRFPIGTRYVIEGWTAAGGALRVYSRFVQYPETDGVWCCHRIHQVNPRSAPPQQTMKSKVAFRFSIIRLQPF